MRSCLVAEWLWNMPVWAREWMGVYMTRFRVLHFNKINTDKYTSLTAEQPTGGDWYYYYFFRPANGSLWSIIMISCTYADRCAMFLFTHAAPSSFSACHILSLAEVKGTYSLSCLSPGKAHPLVKLVLDLQRQPLLSTIRRRCEDIIERIRWRQSLVKGKEWLVQAFSLTWATHSPESELPAVLYSKTDTCN